MNRHGEVKHFRKHTTLDFNRDEIESRRPQQRSTKHHRRPQSKGGNYRNGSGKYNISVVPQNKHEAYHLLFGDKNPWEIAQILNEVWLDPDFRFEVKRNEEM